MPSSLIQNIATGFKSLSRRVLIVENNDGFLFRLDVINALEKEGITVSNQSTFHHRIAFETRDKSEFLILLSKHQEIYLEDIEQNAIRTEFFLESHLTGFHIPTVLNLDFQILDRLSQENPLKNLSKTATKAFLESVSGQSLTKQSSLDSSVIVEEIRHELANEPYDWRSIGLRLGELVSTTIGTDFYNTTVSIINEVNTAFQAYRESYYNQTKASNATKHPSNVNKILDFLSFNYLDQKIALVVIDGLSIWQYKLLSTQLDGKTDENITFSWIPSITQLSRQAIFRGAAPDFDYSQNPRNEEKLWFDYWEKKGVRKSQIIYQYEEFNSDNLQAITKLALVYKDLDEYMHGNCKDYEDLKDLTNNWIKRSQIGETFTQLAKSGFTVFITSDHGNIEAIGWRGLSGRERLGTSHKSGSKSQRHLEYSEQWLFDEFVSSNPELEGSIVKEERAIYFKDNQSFSRKDHLVTHGGAHVLEVLVPFIRIQSEE